MYKTNLKLLNNLTFFILSPQHQSSAEAVPPPTPRANQSYYAFEAGYIPALRYYVVQALNQRL